MYHMHLRHDSRCGFLSQCSLEKYYFNLISEHPVAPKYNKYQHPVNQVHITQVGSQKYPVHPATNQPSYKMRKTTRKGKQQQKDLSCERDADPVFSLDDFADDCEPFFESEEDDLSSGENLISLLKTIIINSSFHL